MSEVLDAAAPLEAYGCRWRPWTRRELLALSAKVECSERMRLMLTCSQILCWCASLKGAPIALAAVGQKKVADQWEDMTEADVMTYVPLAEQEDLASRLMNRFYGEAETEATPDGEEVGEDPFRRVSGA